MTPVPEKAAPTPVPPKTRTPAQEILRKVLNADRKAKKEVAKEREAEQKRLSKEEFDRANREKAAAAKNTPPKIAKIDSVGIANGVNGGSRSSTSGARGTALKAEEGSEIERYTALLQSRLKEELDQTPGLDDGLRAEAEVHITPEGRLTRARITKSSGNDAFDQAVRHAIATVEMPPRPKGLGELQTIPFSTRAKN